MISTMHMGPEFSIETEVEEVEVSTAFGVPEPDMLWKHIDSNGHAHVWGMEGGLPTLEKVVIGTTWVGDEIDGHEENVTEYHCRVCAEVVEPKINYVVKTEYIQGPPRQIVKIGGGSWPIGPKDAYALVEIMNRLRNGTSE